MGMELYIGRVLTTNDPDGGGRIKARIYPNDMSKSLDTIPYAFPINPKVFYSKPKVGEAVIIITSSAGTTSEMRWYLGPVVSQLQFLDFCDFDEATSTLKNASISPEKKEEENGLFGTDDDIAIYGRGNTDIILGENDLRIRCGSRLIDRYAAKRAKYNKDSAYIKLKNYETPLVTRKDDTYGSVDTQTTNTATIVADKINLISTNGNPNISFGKEDENENISDEKMKEIIERAHRLPYGEELVDFLYLFMKMFSEHSHPSDGDKPINGDIDSQNFYNRFNIDKKKLGEKLLSKNVRIS